MKILNIQTCIKCQVCLKIQIRSLGLSNIYNVDSKTVKRQPKTTVRRSKERSVPSNRISRVANFGGLALGLGFGALSEVVRNSLTGSSSDNVVLTEANVERIVDTLCHVRGAALKLGQMLSLQDENMIHPKLATILDRVRSGADYMPFKQMNKVMNQELGPSWQEKFASFQTKPFAAASIGQVHEATLKNGHKVAVKIQYPGVAESIDSDIDNLLMIINYTNLLPKGLYLDNMSGVMRDELAWEVDYEREAKYSSIFRDLLKDNSSFNVPKVITEFSTKRVLTSNLIDGFPLDYLMDADQNTRNLVCEKLMWLTLQELFVFKTMQTDPNWSNFFYSTSDQVIHLLDFGAARTYSSSFVDLYLAVIKFAMLEDRENILKLSRRLGYLTGYENKLMEKTHIDAVLTLGLPFRKEGPFDYGEQKTSKTLHEMLPIMIKHRLCPPPQETYSLHRKLSGLFLLCAKLRANVHCGALFDQIWTNYVFNVPADDDLRKSLKDLNHPNAQLVPLNKVI